MLAPSALTSLKAENWINPIALNAPSILPIACYRHGNMLGTGPNPGNLLKHVVDI
jgi:hypothetical protein